MDFNILIALVVGGVIASFMFRSKKEQPKTTVETKTKKTKLSVSEIETSMGELFDKHLSQKTPDEIIKEADKAHAIWEMQMRSRMKVNEEMNQLARQSQDNALYQHQRINQAAELRAQQETLSRIAQTPVPRFDESGLSLSQYMELIQRGKKPSGKPKKYF